MDSAPYLQAEDAPDFERILEELLQHDEIRQALRRAPGAPAPDRLHGLALRDRAAIAAGARSEYDYYREVREQVRGSAAGPDLDRLGGDDPAQWQAPDSPLDAAERAGWVPLIAVLLPILSGLSAIVMLLLGFLLRAEHASLGQPLITAGFVGAVVCAVAIVVDIIGLLLTAARDAADPPSGQSPDLYTELARARDSWRTALRDQALLPYLLEQAGPPLPVAAGYGAAARSDGISLVRAKPKLGYSSPGFTSPGSERISGEQGQELGPDPQSEPHFSSPGFTSPGPDGLESTAADELGDETGPDPDPGPRSEPGPESPAEPQSTSPAEPQSASQSEPHFSSPGYSRPDFSSPGWSSGTVPAPRARPRSRFLPNADEIEAEAARGHDLDALSEEAEAD
ncbi:hypothetical protein [Streptacidiphilus sp. P02-A3a]|uniref:hypothetical protein n=1 Tax=Streptacidiphilus sp. P02-A3a TaxID=2704468 RepID=UPI0015FE1E10|nr:hypothetical protein [Streptacidiphilus sp. P02-A3a]QMU66898.1 hypothetical protein GXP74_00380 [Streptacidiphilus sp. P02-A3a]